MEWQNHHIRRWYQGLAEFVTVVRYDGRGTGLSQRDVEDVSLEGSVLDLAALVDSFSPDRVAVMGVFHSGPAAMVYTARNPERVSHLIPWCTYATGEAYWQSTQSEGLHALRTTDYQLFIRAAAHELFGWTDDEDADLFAELMRLSVSPEQADRLITATKDYDATHALPEITCPTLVLHRRDLHWLEIGLSRDLASKIPGARLAILDGNSPLPPAGETDALIETIAEFLNLTAPEHRRDTSPGGFRAVLFTDLVNHTQMMSRLGDNRGREVLREHETITRDALHHHGGT
jgi:pimeloyl-ACP methyl ester carboxylesterase